MKTLNNARIKILFLLILICGASGQLLGMKRKPNDQGAAVRRKVRVVAEKQNLYCPVSNCISNEKKNPKFTGFRTREDYYSHLMLIHCRCPWSNVCGLESCGDIARLTHHIKQSHSNESFLQCDNCAYICFGSRALQCHKNSCVRFSRSEISIKSLDRFNCRVAGCFYNNADKDFDNEALFNDHMVRIHKTCPWARSCAKKQSFSELKELYDHIKEEHATESFLSCCTCNNFLSFLKAGFSAHERSCRQVISSYSQAVTHQDKSSEIMVIDDSPIQILSPSPVNKPITPEVEAVQEVETIQLDEQVSVREQAPEASELSPVSKPATPDVEFVQEIEAVQAGEADSVVQQAPEMLENKPVTPEVEAVQEVEMIQPDEQVSVREQALEVLEPKPVENVEKENPLAINVSSLVDLASKSNNSYIAESLNAIVKNINNYLTQAMSELLTNISSANHKQVPEISMVQISENLEKSDQVSLLHTDDAMQIAQGVESDDQATVIDCEKNIGDKNSEDPVMPTSPSDQDFAVMREMDLSFSHNLGETFLNQDKNNNVSALSEANDYQDYDAPLISPWLDLMSVNVSPQDSSTPNPVNVTIGQNQSDDQSVTEQMPQNYLESLFFSDEQCDDTFLSEVIANLTAVEDQEFECQNINTCPVQKKSNYVGITNESGTDCFMNASLQILVHTPEFIKSLESNNSFTSQTMQFFNKMKHQEQSVRGISDLRQFIAQHGASDALKAMEHGMHDAQEFISELLSRLNNENPKLQNIFESLHESDFSCQRCGSHQSKIDPAWHIPLSLPDQLAPITTEFLMNNFFSEEKINDAWCQSCANLGLNRSTKSFKSPEILILSFKRFAYSRHMGPLPRINTPVMIQDFLEVSGKKYELSGLILHHLGRDGEKDHYTSCVKDIDSEQWYHCNDSLVKKITDQDVIKSSSDAYVCFYRPRRAEGERELLLAQNFSENADLDYLKAMRLYGQNKFQSYCIYCEKYHRKFNDLFDHVLSAHAACLWRDLCDNREIFVTKKDLLNHLSTCSHKRENGEILSAFYCEACDYVCYTEKLLELHKMTPRCRGEQGNFRPRTRTLSGNDQVASTQNNFIMSYNFRSYCVDCKINCDGFDNLCYHALYSHRKCPWHYQCNHEGNFLTKKDLYNHFTDCQHFDQNGEALTTFYCESCDRIFTYNQTFMAHKSNFEECREYYENLEKERRASSPDLANNSVEKDCNDCTANEVLNIDSENNVDDYENLSLDSIFAAEPNFSSSRDALEQDCGLEDQSVMTISTSSELSHCQADRENSVVVLPSSIQNDQVAGLAALKESRKCGGNDFQGYCIYCGSIRSVFNALCIHVINKHQVCPWRDLCNNSEIFATKKDLLNHLANCQHVKDDGELLSIFSCESCKKLFMKKRSFQDHKRNNKECKNYYKNLQIQARASSVNTEDNPAEENGNNHIENEMPDMDIENNNNHESLFFDNLFTLESNFSSNTVDFNKDFQREENEVYVQSDNYQDNGNQQAQITESVCQRKRSQISKPRVRKPSRHRALACPLENEKLYFGNSLCNNNQGNSYGRLPVVCDHIARDHRKCPWSQLISKRGVLCEETKQFESMKELHNHLEDKHANRIKSHYCEACDYLSFDYGNFKTHKDSRRCQRNTLSLEKG